MFCTASPSLVQSTHTSFSQGHMPRTINLKCFNTEAALHLQHTKVRGTSSHVRSPARAASPYSNPVAVVCRTQTSVIVGQCYFVALVQVRCIARQQPTAILPKVWEQHISTRLTNAQTFNISFELSIYHGASHFEFNQIAPSDTRLLQSQRSAFSAFDGLD